MEIQHLRIGGKTLQGTAGTRKVLDPYDLSIVGEVSYGDRAQASDAIDAARSAFKQFKSSAAYQRAEVLRKASELIAARKDELATLITRESGKPILAARLEVERAVFTFRSAAEAAARAHEGEVLDMTVTRSGAQRSGSFRYFPIGVVLAITPFNYPLNLVAHKVAPAIASGNTVVLKPAPQTPLTAFMLADIMQEAGLPPGVLNVITCDNEVAETMVRDERIAMLSFTGSDTVGWKLKSIAGRAKVALELGGNGFVIVHDTDDLDRTIDVLARGAFNYAGQICISVQNLLVRREMYDEVVRAMVASAESISVGDPKLEDTVVGPMISEAAAKKVEQWIEDAEASGAKRLTGDLQLPNVLTPTVLTDVPHDSTIYQHEAFAPVVIIEAYDSIEEAIEIVNASTFGLQAGLFTNDMRVIQTAYEKLDVGGLIVNDSNAFRLDTMPYGGVKSSGFGREGILFAMREMSEIKMLVLKS
ncbi:MAG TPA: aldehyde dehydrogenase family protein [Candidatus Kapabacteria bacterium]|nr:aldehyde dehydrogenase family protein [Candidatus Kapabacteria bacterium]